MFREVASGAKTDRTQLRRVIDQLAAGDELTVTRLDRLARSTRDLLNTLAAIGDRKAGFRSLADAWAIPPRLMAVRWSPPAQASPSSSTN
jgi:DNA invertase Pin-like site-specific DNA recombinase